MRRDPAGIYRLARRTYEERKYSGTLMTLMPTPRPSPLARATHATMRTATRAAALAGSALETLVHQGPRAWGLRQWLWVRKRYYYAVGRARAIRALAAGLPRTGTASTVRAVPHDVSSQLRVCYIASIEELLSKRYRVDNMLEQLRLAGAIGSAIYDIDAFAQRDRVLTADLIVVQRVPASAELRALLALAHDCGIALAYDADDYVFDPTIEPHVAALHHAPAAKVEEWRRTIQGCRDLMLRCDAFIGSTRFLAQRAEALGRPAFVIPNGVNQRQVELAEVALARRRASHATMTSEGGRPIIRIGYLSGTATHQRDFALVVPALVRILGEYPATRLVLRGPVALPPELAPFARRIERRPFVAWERLIAATAALDITLAPLESDNPFTEGKSALKYVESGLVGVPVIASPTQEYRGAVRAGETGLLAVTTEEWYDGLRLLVGDSARRRAMGAAARADVLARYTPQAQCGNTLAVLTQIARQYAGNAARARSVVP